VVAIKDYPILWGQKYLPDFQRMHQHENIVSILGYCVYTKVENMLDLEEAKDHVLVVEEYLPNGMLLDIFEGKFPSNTELKFTTNLNSFFFRKKCNNYSGPEVIFLICILCLMKSWFEFSH
jgi:hypothetical protein